MRRTPLILLVLVQASRLAAGSVNVTAGSPSIGAAAYTSRGTVSITDSNNALGEVINTATSSGTLSPTPLASSTTNAAPYLPDFTLASKGSILTWGCQPADSVAAFGIGSVTIFSGATLDLTGLVVANSITLNGGTISGSVSSADTTQDSGTIAGMGGSGSLTKGGSGVLTFSGANTYTGTTTVSSGTLAVSVPTFDDTSTISVAAGAVLNLNFAGTDIVGSLVLNGVTQAPGIYGSSNSGGLISGTGSLTVPAPVNFGASYVWEINSATPTGNLGIGDDLLNITGSGTLPPSNLTVGTLTPSNLTATNPVGTSGYSWTIVSTTGGVTGFDANAISLDTSGFSAWSWSVSTGGNDIQLVYVGDTSTPPPSTTSTSSTSQDPNGDTDGDGVSNLLENAFGSDPLLPGGSRLPRPLLDLADSETHAGLTYTRSKTVLGVTFNVEFSSTPADSGFAPAPFTETSVTDNGDGTETVTVRETAPSTGTRFARLRVIQN